MIRFGQYVALSALGLLLCGNVALGQAKDATPTNATSVTVPRNLSGRIVAPEPSPSAALSPLPWNSITRPERPERFLAPEVQEQLRKFLADREKYLKEQERLEKQLKGSTEQERQMIRDRIQQVHDSWASQARRFRDEARERQKELKRALPKHRDALNEIRPGQRGRQPAGLD